jgi:hypothetical protein
MVSAAAGTSSRVTFLARAGLLIERMILAGYRLADLLM